MAKRRHHRRNPGSVTLRRPLGALTAGFKPAALATAAPIAVGALGNFLLRKQVARFLPIQASVGPLSYVTGLATAGLMLLVPKYGSRLFVGAVTEEALRALNEYVMKGGINLSGLLGLDEDSYDEGGLDDYEQARMNDYEQSMSDYQTATEGVNAEGSW